MEEKNVFVIGHKNPDSDSICSAIAYANLKNIMANTNEFIACRAGELNNETNFILSYFNIPTPRLIADVSTQVKDMHIDFISGTSSNMSLQDAWTIMRTNMLNTLPITSGEKLIGLITVTDITKQNMDIFDNYILSKAKTSYENLLHTVTGILVSGDPGIINNGKIVVGAAESSIMAQYVDKHDIVILGNREDNQKLALESNASCLIICLNAPVSKEILSLAKEKGARIIVTPYDTYTTARLINQSIPISHIMRTEKLVTFSLDTPTEDVKHIMASLRHRDFPVLNEDGTYVGMISRRSLLETKQKQLILVDHNEKTQAVDGIQEAKILEIVDHHRLGGMETISPVFFRNQPLGSTATIIATMYNEHNVSIDKSYAGLLCAAILSDTLMFRSPTCTSTDVDVAKKLSKIAGIEIEAFATEMFAKGSDWSNKTDEEILYQDYKVFNVKDIRFGVGQINALGHTALNDVKARLQKYLAKDFSNQNTEMLFFLLTDILEESSTLLVYGKNSEKVVSHAFPASVQAADTFYLQGVVSRKKQFIPLIMQALQEM